MFAYKFYPWRYRHPLERLNADYGYVAENRPCDDTALIERIMAAFAAASRTDLGARDNMWLQYFAEKNADTHRILHTGSHAEYTALLRDPAASYLLYGFDGPTQIEAAAYNDPGSQEVTAHNTYDALLSLATALNVARADNPEALLPGQGPDVETLLGGLDEVLGFRLTFPNLFRADMGIASSRGVITHRAIMAVYQAWRIFQAAGRNPDARILEIGAGLGRNGYFAHAFGIRDYTIVDLPTTNVCQAYFLGRTLGEDAVSLYGEASSARVKIIPPEAFFSSNECYDIIANIDSMSEFSLDTARRYLAAVLARSTLFLSINHENNAFTVRNEALSLGAHKHSPRMPHWMRRGYVEELFST